MSNADNLNPTSNSLQGQSLQPSESVGLFDMIFAPLAMVMGVETPATKALHMAHQRRNQDLTLVTPPVPTALPPAQTHLVGAPSPALTPTLVVVPSLELTPAAEQSKPHLALTPYMGRSAPGHLASSNPTQPSGVAKVGTVTPAALPLNTETLLEICTTPGVMRPLYQGVRGSYNTQSAWVAASMVNEILRIPSLALDWPFTQKVLRVLNKVYSSEVITKVAELHDRPRSAIEMYCMIADPVYDKPRVIKLNYGPETSRAVTHLDFLVRGLAEACQHVRRWDVLAAGRSNPDEQILAGFRDIADFLQHRVHSIPEENATPQYYRDKLAKYPVVAAKAIGAEAEEAIKSSVRVPITIEGNIDLSEAILPGNEDLGPDMSCAELEFELNGLGAS